MKIPLLLLLTGLLTVQPSCTSTEQPTALDLAAVPLIPQPTSVTATGSSFRLTPETMIYTDGSSDELTKIGQHLTDYLRPATGFQLPVEATDAPPEVGHIYLTLADDNDLGEEGYELTVTEEQIQLTAARPVGLFWGLQTLRQLLPAAIEGSTPQTEPWEIATGTIRDVPTYAYRGAMLDVARHFFGPDDVKQYIDYLVRYKMNALHLHLTDDQGWRIEIKSWPKLTTVGGSTAVGGGAGGYYTQEQYADLVQYAQDRHVLIVPEIDVPGHTNAALAAYPELNCDGLAPELYTGTEVGFSTLCTDKEVTYQFINDVFGELAALTPGPYLHIGGDESHATAPEDYVPFVNRVQEIVQSHGKQVIGWDEIATATLVPNAVAQYWDKAENAQAAVEQGAKVLISPASRSYLDMQYDSTTELGLHWAGYVEVQQSYDWDPATLVEGITKEDILGIEAPLWTETITTMDELEYMVFPRLLGLAEIGWSPPSVRDWNTYKVRLGKQQDRLDAMGINYYPSPTVPWTSGLADSGARYQRTTFTPPYAFTAGIEGPAADQKGSL